MKKTIWVLLGLYFFGSHAIARPPEEAEFVAAGILGDDIAEWFSDIEPRPKSLGLFSIRPTHPLDQDYAAIIEAFCCSDSLPHP